jgi:glycerol uptake facilitator
VRFVQYFLLSFFGLRRQAFGFAVFNSNTEKERSSMASQSGSAPSALSGTYGEMIGEFFGTMVLILFGDGCVATFALFTKLGGASTPFANEWIVIILGWGLAVMLGIYVAGAISGAHINPAVTLALAATGRHPWSKVLPYWLAQVLGAFVAAAILWFVYHGALQATIGTGAVTSVGGVFYTSPKAFVGTFGAFGDEFIGTALLVGLILAIVDGRNQPVQANLNPLIIGFLIVAIGASFGLNTGYAINPARDFGPRLWIGFVSGFESFSVNNYYFWVPIVAPLLGGVVGAFIFDYTIGKVLQAKMLMKSGTAETIGEAVREPSAE